ncbi:YicC/YloC family endoribonuclease [Alkalicoccus luteus]|uniref:YicC family protein n=1 Tax=Alkalicoccus luteus TaxID=1237094 RepID=A0A969TSB8_9BACI|nr:YicC/YloC family endoribonuclease [Alkalicoccus luteus]NJP36413.1 YicC family protein [Alkalicoccus luteus]
MLRSMTGFGRSEGSVQGSRLTVEIKTVNHRFRDVSVKLPKGWGILEPAFRSTLEDKLIRGRVEIHVHVSSTEQAGKLTLDRERLKQYADVLSEINQVLHTNLTVEATDHLFQAGVIRESEALPGLSVMTKAVIPLFEEALEEAVEMRCSEGKALQQDLLINLGSLKNLRAETEQSFLESRKDVYSMLKRKLEQFLHGTGMEEQRVVQEAAVLAEKADISEELSRMASHISQFYETCVSGSPAGRRLEFILQEINRETNTIGSKSGSEFVGRQVVEMKDVLEKMREQVQNAE